MLGRRRRPAHPQVRFVLPYSVSSRSFPPHPIPFGLDEGETVTLAREGRWMGARLPYVGEAVQVAAMMLEPGETRITAGWLGMTTRVAAVEWRRAGAQELCAELAFDPLHGDERGLGLLAEAGWKASD